MIDSEPEIFEKVKEYEFAKKEPSKTSDICLGADVITSDR